MIKNFLLVAFRSMARQLSYSIINVVGLAIGIACSLVIFLFVYGEWSYDRGWTNSERIYKIGISFFNIGNFANGPERLLNVLPEQFDGIETATRVKRQSDLLITVQDKSFHEDKAFYTDSSFFKVFQHEFIAGNGIKAPADVVLTESAARKYFGTTEALGKSVLVGPEKKEFFVTGIVKDIEFNATAKAEMFFAINEFLKDDPNWSSASLFSFVLLKENFGRADLEAALDRVSENNVFPESGKPMGIATLEDFKKNANSVRFHLHSLQDIYLKSDLRGEMVPGGSMMNIYIFSAISTFILILAGVNFINLTTARASRRAKEVGIRKTMGTSRRKLILQFLSESVMISTVSMILSLLLAEIFLIAFTYVTGTPLLPTIWKNPSTVFLFAGFSVLVGICSGLYPAFYLTAFNPVRVLKGNVSARGGAGFRNGLVIFQFAVSMVLIVCAFIVQQQLNYVQTKELGFDESNILTIDGLYNIDHGKAEAFKNTLDAQAGVLKSATSLGEPGSKRFMSFYMYQTKEMTDGMTVNTYPVDADYMDLMGIKVIEGRTFDKDLASDTASIILNEAAVIALGINGNPIGTIINNESKVIGVVRDFHWESMHNAIGPLSFVRSKKIGHASFKLEPGHVKDFIATAETTWKEIEPNKTFSYHFVDQNFAEMLKKDEVFGKAMNFFTMLAIFISCLGLYGLSAYTAEQRTKEIGIRKVLGASSSQIVLMLNRKFTILISVAIALSIPLSIWLISQWLDSFAYKITPGAGVYVGSVAIALLTAWITVSLHSIRASWVNPSDALKYE
jgi:putative ABC transport system permease protein